MERKEPFWKRTLKKLAIVGGLIDGGLIGYGLIAKKESFLIAGIAGLALKIVGLRLLEGKSQKPQLNLNQAASTRAKLESWHQPLPSAA
jgi:hypothetical protein